MSCSLRHVIVITDCGIESFYLDGLLEPLVHSAFRSTLRLKCDSGLESDKESPVARSRNIGIAAPDGTRSEKELPHR